jgi:hypothetical protein
MNNGKDQKKSRKNMNVKHNLNEYTRHESLTVSDVETP